MTSKSDGALGKEESDEEIGGNGAEISEEH
jgi:hypothetical protein